MSLHSNEPVFEVVEEAGSQDVDAAEVADTETYDPDLEDDRDGEQR